MFFSNRFPPSLLLFSLSDFSLWFEFISPRSGAAYSARLDLYSSHIAEAIGVDPLIPLLVVLHLLLLPLALWLIWGRNSCPSLRVYLYLLLLLLSVVVEAVSSRKISLISLFLSLHPSLAPCCFSPDFYLSMGTT